MSEITTMTDDNQITLTCTCGLVLRWSGAGYVTVEPCPLCIGGLEMERDEALAVACTGPPRGEHACDAVTERDKARAECERLKESRTEHYWSAENALDKLAAAERTLEAVRTEIFGLERERDKARAECERLKESRTEHYWSAENALDKLFAAERTLEAVREIADDAIAAIARVGGSHAVWQRHRDRLSSAILNTTPTPAPEEQDDE